MMKYEQPVPTSAGPRDKKLNGTHESPARAQEASLFAQCAHEQRSVDNNVRS